MERKRFADRGLVSGWLCPDLFEFPDVVHLRLGHRLQRPRAVDPILPHVEQSRAVRRQQPLVETRADEVRFKVTQSTMLTMPRWRAMRQRRWTGKSWPVMLVRWQMCSTFVRGVTAPSRSR